MKTLLSAIPFLFATAIGLAQSEHVIGKFTATTDFYTAFNAGSGTVNQSINSTDYSEGTSSLQLNYSFNAGTGAFYSALRNYGTVQKDYSLQTTGFSIHHKGGHADDRISVRLWEDINGNGAYDGEDEVYESAAEELGTTDWTTSTFPINSFTKIVGTGNGTLDLNRIRAWDVKIANKSSTAHTSQILIDELSLNTSYTPPTEGEAKLNGAFIQLWNTAGCKCGNWTQQQWDDELQKMKDAELSSLIVQYSVYHDLTWYSPSNLPFVTYKQNTLNRIVAAAEKVGIQVHFGLYFDETWNSSNKALASSYSTILTKHKAVVDELWSLFGSSPSFGGWYIPQELNDLEWQEDPEKTLLFNWIKDVSDYVKVKSASKPIMIAPFFNLWQPADEIETWYKELLSTATNLDRVYPQDGVGIRLKDVNYHVPLYYAAIKRACDMHGKTFGATIETFHQTSGWPVNNGAFAATSANMDRLKSQLWAAEEQSAHVLIQFSWSYMQPDLTPASTQLFNDYTGYVSSLESVDQTTYGTDQITACNSHTWIDGITYNESNNSATHTVKNTASADSIITLDLIINKVSNTTVNITDGPLVANNDNANYQWISKNDGIIEGETNQQFNPDDEGIYALILTENGCSDTSDYIIVQPLNTELTQPKIKTYPNPSSGSFTIELEHPESDITVNIINVAGQVLDKYHFQGNHNLNLPLDYPSGVYFIELNSTRGKEVIRVVRE